MQVNINKVINSDVELLHITNTSIGPIIAKYLYKLRF